jgi:4-hydroxybutyryl-CoA dehydratase / vinylacetyl-CoA-Delta-isomerase
VIRTPKQYVESLNDGREIYINGEKIPDITKNPLFRGPINARAMSYYLYNHSTFKDLLTPLGEDGQRSLFLWKQPRTSEDLVKRRNLYLTCMRWGASMSGMGPDSLAATGIVSKRIDKAMGTRYAEAVEDYRRHLRETDPAITGAITDVKGNRSLRPSQQVQHKDFYVRVVDKNKDGIVVRGAKMHISATPTANEIIVQPCRAHKEEDKDYAVVFATPLNAPGVKLFTSPPFFEEDGDEAMWNWPASGRFKGVSECMIVFDDVFVPWNRVFMCGEWQFTRDQAWMFGVFHRLFGTCHKVISTERIAGTAKLMAEYNGVEKYPHIQEKLSWLAMHTQLVDILAQSACEHADYFPDIDLAAPNMRYTNIAKFMFANGQHEASKLLSDITGGIACTVFNHKDWMNPEQRPYLEKYLAGIDGVSTEDRLKAVRLAKDLTGHHHDILAIHAEGSLAAQKMAIYASADWERFKAQAKRIAGIDGWKDHPSMAEIPDYPNKWIIDGEEN